MFRRRVARVLIILLILLVSVAPTPAYAIAPPDTAPQVMGTFVYQLDDGGLGVLVDYYLDYAVLPTEIVTEAYLAVFVDTDGATQLKSAAPYTFVSSGYGRGLVWMQFTAAEVATYGLTSANQALYRIWLTGNPGLTWTGAIPKTIATIDYWQTTGDPKVLLALRVLYYADKLEVIWSLDLIQNTSQGNKLTTLGESYFVNVIPNLQTLAPAAFAAGTLNPTIPEQDFRTYFGATMTNQTGNVTGSPIALASGANTVSVTGAGTFWLYLLQGTSGNVTSGTGTVAGSPVQLVSGNNTINATIAGTLVVRVTETSIVTRKSDQITGTSLDMTAAASMFGMSRWVFSSLVWLLLSIIICATLFAGARNGQIADAGAGKLVMFVFNLCIIGGGVLGLLHPLVTIAAFIIWSVFIGFVMFYKPANV